MASEYDWQNDGGIFMAEDADGYRLADDLDKVFGQADVSPQTYMEDHYPDVIKDIVPDRFNWKEKLTSAPFIGFVAVASLIGIKSIWIDVCQFANALRSIR